MSIPFVDRHIGPRPSEVTEMLGALGLATLDELIQKTVPASIRSGQSLQLAQALSEEQALETLRSYANQNSVFRSFIGLGYYGSVTPAVIRRNILQNPGWYTQYTPYQAEISQGRLEALINFQTMVADLTGLPLANASLLDEGTAAAEAMTFAHRICGNDKRHRFFISTECFPQTIEVVAARAAALGFEIVSGDYREQLIDESFFGALVQYPTADGEINDYSGFADTVHKQGGLLIAAADILALTMLAPPGEWGADVAVGSTQRFGVPMGFGGPHAAYFATKYEHSRQIPGRVIGVSKDAEGRAAYRLAVQVREQHIRRERATSNICTAQVLLAIMASMYAVYHGPEGLRAIACAVHDRTRDLARRLLGLGIKTKSQNFFDTLRLDGVPAVRVLAEGIASGINFRRIDDSSIGVTLDETVTDEDVSDIVKCFAKACGKSPADPSSGAAEAIPESLARRSPFLTHEVFSRYRSETELLRYIQRLQSKDLSLTASMIPLGSCTMKLNATAEMEPVTWPEFSAIHPFVPADQARGYGLVISELEQMLAEITGMSAVSLQPNAGSQGEYAGLLAIRAYHRAKGTNQRDICLIPASAHGTNPASAAMAGMRVVVVNCDANGNVDLGDLRAKIEQHHDKVAALMVTYPSTHGVFEEGIRHICDMVHGCGALVYMDGANLNAQVGLCRPGDFGVDVCHLNLHKTFCIPHGGGGPGVGPIAVKQHLAPYLPGHNLIAMEGRERIAAVSAAPWGSALILVIPWMYIKMMGGQGLTRATEIAILSANYIAKRLESDYPVLYKGENGFVAHECILDLRAFKRSTGIEVQDVAKRLMDYGFHAPTVSFPVPETLMVEPTESESKQELDRFCEALSSIRQEIREIEEGRADSLHNILKNAPHTVSRLTADKWDFPYSREQAAFPVEGLRNFKFWPASARIDSAYGDRNLFCSCIPVRDESDGEDLSKTL